jgi:type IV pilus assembly protein PilN
MIKINLIPPRISKRELQLRSELAILGFLVFLTLTVWIYVVAQIISEKDSWSAKIASHTKRLDILKPVEKEIEDFKKQREVLKSRQETIDKLVNARTGPARIMQDIARAKPTKLWLTSFKQKDASLILEGVADDSSTVIEFVNRLRERESFESVETQSLQESSDTKSTLSKASGLKKTVKFKLQTTVSTKA